MTADWTGCVLLTCATVSSGQLARSTKLTQQVAVNAQVPKPNSCKHTHVQPVHTHLQPHIHQPGLLSERLVHCDWLTDWAIHVHAPTISFHLGTKERGGGERQKNAGDDGGDSSCLFIWNIFSEGNRAEEKKFFFSPFIVEMMDLLSQ